MEYSQRHAITSLEADFYIEGEAALLRRAASRLIEDAIHIRHESGKPSGVYTVQVSFRVDDEGGDDIAVAMPDEGVGAKQE